MSGLSSWFRGLRAKLLFLIVLPVSFMIVMSYFSITTLKSQVSDSNIIAKEKYPKSVLINKLRIELNAGVRLLWASVAITDPATTAEKVANAKERFKGYEDSLTELKGLKLTDKMRGLLEPVASNWAELSQSSNEALALILKSTPETDVRAKDMILRKVIPPFNRIIAAQKAMGELISAQVEESISEAEKNSTRGISIMLALSVIGSVLLSIIGIFTASLLTSALAGITRNVGEASSQVESASEQLSAASQEVSAGATEAASSLEETVSSLEELSSMVKLNADNAKEASSLSQTSKASAEQGEQEIKTLIESMTDISQSSKKIEDIINVIDDIAFQTNLLALNAAVEAARAGEQGKGFAVVAEAVRTLAARSASAAKEITALIKDSVNKIERGTKVADSSGVVLKNIVVSVKKVSDLNGEIASASQEQANGISQISKAMNQLDQATQTNAASSEEVASSSTEMSSQAVSLQELVDQLLKLVNGDGSHSLQGNEGMSGRSEKVQKFPSRPSQLKSKGRTLVASRQPVPQNVIPFDTDSTVSKVGTTDGF
jgi:methyl-accepting chemotaxis protein